MSRLIDADVLEREGWSLSRNRQMDEKTMVYEVKKPTDFPPVEPERKTGKWEIYVISPFDGEGCRCSECKYEGAPYWNFCPNCGIKIRGVNNDNI